MVQVNLSRQVLFQQVLPLRSEIKEQPKKAAAELLSSWVQIPYRVSFFYGVAPPPTSFLNLRSVFQDKP